MQKNRILYRTMVSMKPEFSREDFIRLANSHASLVEAWDGQNCFSVPGFTGSSSSSAIAFRFYHDGISEEAVFCDGRLTISMSGKAAPSDIPRCFLSVVADYIAPDEATGWAHDGRAHIVTMSDTDLIKAIMSGKTRCSVPIVYISISRTFFQPYVNAESLARDARGMFFVVQEAEAYMTNRLRDPDSKWTAPFGGAIDIYWPDGDKWRIVPKGWDLLYSDTMVRAKIMTNCSFHRYPSVTLGQPQVMVDGLGESAGVECEGVAKLPQTLEAMRNGFAEALEDSKAEYEEYTRHIEQKESEANDRLVAATNEVRRLKSIVEHRATESAEISLSCNEQEFYPGELRDVVLETLQKAVDSAALDSNLRERRSFHVLSAILEANSVSAERRRLVGQMESALAGGGKSTKDDERMMLQLGFEQLPRSGGHLRFTYHGDPRYTVTLACSASDRRAGENSARQIVQKLFL